MHIWHMSGNHKLGLYSRAFAKPVGFYQRVILFIRGWKPFNEYWWSKPSKQLKEVLKYERLF